MKNLFVQIFLIIVVSMFAGQTLAEDSCSYKMTASSSFKGPEASTRINVVISNHPCKDALLYLDVVDAKSQKSLYSIKASLSTAFGYDFDPATSKPAYVRKLAARLLRSFQVNVQEPGLSEKECLSIPKEQYLRLLSQGLPVFSYRWAEEQTIYVAYMPDKKQGIVIADCSDDSE